MTSTLRIKSEHRHLAVEKKRQEGETTQIPHLSFLPFFPDPLFFPARSPKRRSIFPGRPLDSKLLNHLGKPGLLLLDARSYGDRKTTFSNSCTSFQPPPTDGGMISTASVHPPVARALGWLIPKRRAKRCGNEEPRRRGYRL